MKLYLFNESQLIYMRYLSLVYICFPLEKLYLALHSFVVVDFILTNITKISRDQLMILL